MRAICEMKMIHSDNSPKRWLRFTKDCKASIAIEFAIILPVLLILLFPTIDYARYILLQQKIIKGAYVIADAVSMSTPVEPGVTTQTDIDTVGTYLTEDLLRALTNTADLLMMPFPPEAGSGTDRYNVEITHIYNSTPGGSTPTIGWQYDQNSQTLTVGGGATTLPDSLQNNLDDDENLIRVRFTAIYDPITPPLQGLGIPFLARQTREHTSYFRARYGDLRNVWQ